MQPDIRVTSIRLLNKPTPPSKNKTQERGDKALADGNFPAALEAYTAEREYRNVLFGVPADGGLYAPAVACIEASRAAAALQMVFRARPVQDAGAKLEYINLAREAIDKALRLLAPEPRPPAGDDGAVVAAGMAATASRPCETVPPPPPLSIGGDSLPYFPTYHLSTFACQNSIYSKYS